MNEKAQLTAYREIFKKPFPSAASGGFHISFGGLQVWIEKFTREFHLYSGYIKNTDSFYVDAQKKTSPHTLERYKWIAADLDEAYYLFPALPDRPLVVRSQTPLKIPAKVTGNFFLLIPTFLQISRTADKESVLWEKASEGISGTWFGEMSTGELGYSQETSFYQELINLPSKSHMAICPLKIINQSKNDLEFERLCLEVQHLSLYMGKENLWTNNVSVTYQGDERVCEINLSRTPPHQEEDVQLISKPRVSAGTGKLRNTFDKIKKLTGM